MTVAKRSQLKVFDILRHPSLSVILLAVGILITLGFILIALLAPVFQSWGWLQDPTFIPTDLNSPNPQNLAPSLSHLFGTSSQGYDVFSRTLFGTQAALQVVFWATIVSLLVGVPLGMVSGYLGGKLDKVLLFLTDTIYTLPKLLLSITLAFIVGRGVMNAVFAVSISYIAKYYRIVRNHTASVKNELFIEAAQAMGASTPRVLSKYLFLNVIQSVPVILTLNAADAILTLSSLGFLGLGLPEGTPEWGHDLKVELSVLSSTGIWWSTFFPGLALTLLVVGLSLIGEGLTEVINPRSRKQVR
jgi:peptide/nickel transport system permease protein